MKTILAFLSLLILSNTYAQIGIGVVEGPPRVSYKTENPDSTKLPLNRQEVYSLCSYLQPGAESPQVIKEADKIWEALTDPVNFDSKEEPNCSWMAGEDPKPILTVWSQTNEMEFARKVLFKKFFCSFPSFEHPNSADYFYESTLTGQKLLAPFAIEPCMGCKQPVKELLSVVQKRISEKGWTLVFMDKGSYYSNAYATVIARKADLLSLEKLLLRMQMRMLTFEQLLAVAK